MTSAGHLTPLTSSLVPLMRLSLCGMLPRATSCISSVRPSNLHRVLPGTLSETVLPLSAWTGKLLVLEGIITLWGPHMNGVFVQTDLSIHRSLRVYSSQSLKLLSAVNKGALGQGGASKTRLYHDESMPSFFRRLSYSPDGALLITPGRLQGSGCWQVW